MLSLCILSLRKLLPLRFAQFTYCQIKKLELHSDILSYHEIQKTIASQVMTPEKKLIDSLNNGKLEIHSWYTIKKSKTWSYIAIEDAISIIKALEKYNHQKQLNNKIPNNQSTLPATKVIKSKELLVIDNIYSTFISYFKSKLANLTVSQMAIILQKYAYANRFDQSFFREIENELYERFLDKSQMFQVWDVEKILWAYQFCYYGSAILYNKLSQTIKIAQYEIHPLKLAYFAYLFTKSPENINGGYGIYNISEQRVKERINDLNLTELIKLTKYYYVPNIGTNAFQILLEEKICEKLQGVDKIPIPNLISLVKSTSKYIFRYNDKALYHKIEVIYTINQIVVKSACISLLEHFTDNQFSEVVWSFLRSRKGNHIFYEKVESQLNSRVKNLTLRQLTLLYMHSSRNNETQEISDQLLKEIIIRMENDQEIQRVKQSYIIYLLISIVKSEYKNNNVQILEGKLMNHLIKNASATLTKLQKISLLSALSQSLLDQNQIQLIQQLLRNINFEELNLDHKIIYKYSNSLFHRFEKFNIDNFTLEEQVNKQVYHQALYLFPQVKRNLDVLDLLYHSHGQNTRFCFRQDNWVVISWIMLSENVIMKNILVDQNIINQACEGIKEIDINTLNLNNIQKYAQSLWMVKQIKKIPEQQIYPKLLKLIKSKQKNLQKQLAILNNFNLISEQWLSQVKQNLTAILQQQMKNEKLLEDSQLISYTNLFDSPSMSIIPISCIIQLEDISLRFGVIPLSIEYDFNSVVKATKEFQNSIGKNDFESIKLIRKELQIQKWVLSEQLGWNIEFIVKEVWDELNEEQKLNYLTQVFTIEVEEQPEIQVISSSKKRQSRQKGSKLKQKLDQVNQKKEYLQSDEQEDEEM